MKKYNLISIGITIFSLLAFVLTANAATQDSSTFFLNPGDSSTSASSGSWNGGGKWAGGDSSSAADSSADAGFVSQTNTNNQGLSTAAKTALIAGAVAAVAGGTALALSHHGGSGHNNNSSDGTIPSTLQNALVKVHAEFKGYKASDNDHPTVTITFTDKNNSHKQYSVSYTEGQSDPTKEIPQGTYDVSGSPWNDYGVNTQHDVFIQGSKTTINLTYNKDAVSMFYTTVKVHVTFPNPNQVTADNAKVTILFDDLKYNPRPHFPYVVTYIDGEPDPNIKLPQGTYDVSGTQWKDYTINTQEYPISGTNKTINLTYSEVKTPVDISVNGLPPTVTKKLNGNLTNTSNSQGYPFHFQANGAVDPDPLNVTPGTYSIGVDSYKTIDGYTYDATASLEKEYHISDKQMSIPIIYSVTAVPVKFEFTGLPVGDEAQKVNVILVHGQDKEFSETIKNGGIIPYVAVGQDPYTVAAADFTYNGKSYTADSIPPVTITKQTTIPITYHENDNPTAHLTFNLKYHHHIDQAFMKIKLLDKYNNTADYDQTITDGKSITLPKGVYNIIPQEIACRDNTSGCGKAGDRYDPDPQYPSYTVDLEQDQDQSVDIFYNTDPLPNKLQTTMVTIKRPQDDKTASCTLDLTFIKGNSNITDTRTVTSNGSNPYTSTKFVYPGTYAVTATKTTGAKDYEVNINIPNSPKDHPNWLVVGLSKKVKPADPITATIKEKAPPGIDHVFAGIWQNNGASNPFIPLSKVNKGYNVVIIQSGSVAIDGTASFEPTSDYDNGYGGKAGFKNDLKALQAEGTKVLLSFGDSLGNTYDFNSTNYMTFVNSVIPLIHEYGFDGINFGYGPNSELTSDNGLYLSMAIEKIKSIYEQQYGKQLLITASPDIAQTYWQKNWETGTGGYDTAIKNHDLDYVFVGLLSDKYLNGYNNPNGTCYQPGTVSFITSQTDATVRHWINDLGLTEVGAKKLFVPQFALYNNQPASTKGTPEIIKKSFRCMATHKAADCTDDPINDKNSYTPALAPYKIANISNTYINGDYSRSWFFLNSLHSCVVDGNCTDKVY